MRNPDRYDNVTHRPWPVSPSQYPLSGPSRGPVYTPPPGGSAFKLLMTLAYIAVIMFAFAFTAYIVASVVFKGD